MFFHYPVYGGIKWECLSAFSTAGNSEGHVTEKTTLEAYEEIILDLGSDINAAILTKMVKKEDPFNLPEELSSTHSTLQNTLANFKGFLLENFSDQYEIHKKNILEALKRKIGSQTAEKSKSETELKKSNRKGYGRIPWKKASSVYPNTIEFLPAPFAFIGAQWYSPLYISVDGKTVTPLNIAFTEEQKTEMKIKNADTPSVFKFNAIDNRLYLTYPDSPYLFAAPVLDDQQKPLTTIHPVPLIKDDETTNRTVGMTFTEDGESLLYYTDKGAKLLSLNGSGKPKKLKIPSSFQINLVSIDSASKRLLVLGEEKVIYFDSLGNRVGDGIGLWKGDRSQSFVLDESHFYSTGSKSAMVVSPEGDRMFYASNWESNQQPVVHSVNLITGEVSELVLPIEHVTPNEFDNGPKIKDMQLALDGKVLILSTAPVRNPGVPIVPKLVAIDLETGQADSFQFRNGTIVNGFVFNPKENWGYASLTEKREIHRIPFHYISPKFAE